jgi:hypothetical protein
LNVFEKQTKNFEISKELFVVDCGTKEPLSLNQFPKIVENQELFLENKKVEFFENSNKFLEKFDVVSYSKYLQSHQYGRILMYIETITSTQLYFNQ